jgi:chromosome partitioning protein
MARQAARQADLILIPCRPKAFDLAAIETTADLVRASGRPAAVVFIAGPPKAPLIYKEAAELIASLGLTVAPTGLAERGAFHHATARGLTAGELEPQSKAAHEVEALWAWVCEQLNMTAREPVHEGTR